MSVKKEALDRYLRAVHYLAGAQIYLQSNVLLREPLKPEHVKKRLLGHWGTCPGINLVYAHLNRLIRRADLDAILITGPGHGAPANLANLYLEGSLREFYPEAHARRGWTGAVRPGLLLAGWISESSLSGCARDDSRGWGTRLRAGDCLRRGV